jgi:hypothetical protein
VVICVPGRKDRWSFEDETVGHLRRYDRADLYRVLEAVGLKGIEIWSVAVPIANILFRISAWLVRNSNEAKKVGLSQREQTETSGLREIPWKTAFPPWAKLILNRYTLYPLLVLQRLFYRTGLGCDDAGVWPRTTACLDDGSGGPTSVINSFNATACTGRPVAFQHSIRPWRSSVS